jgi:hypothetical protein
LSEITLTSLGELQGIVMGNRTVGQPCICLNGPLRFDQYDEISYIGVDETNGRYGDVTLKQCKHCGRYWLHYLVEYEAFTGSGRYYMGLITPEAAKGLKPEDAVEYLNSLEWHLYGGAYFGGRKGKSTGAVWVDL